MMNTAGSTFQTHFLRASDREKIHILDQARKAQQSQTPRHEARTIILLNLAQNSQNPNVRQAANSLGATAQTRFPHRADEIKSITEQMMRLP